MFREKYYNISNEEIIKFLLIKEKNKIKSQIQGFFNYKFYGLKQFGLKEINLLNIFLCHTRIIKN